MTDEFIPLAPPLIGAEEVQGVCSVLSSEWLTTGPRTRQFEDEFAAFVGSDAALGLNSCTGALHTALVAMGVGVGDEVITTPMTFCATVNVIEQAGAKPVLVDVEPDTLNMDPAGVAAAVTAKTKAIIPVHYGGHPADMDPILATAQEHGLHVLEDAAHALPATYRGRKVGSGPNPVAFSFYATKNLTTGEGGMLTGSADLIAWSRIVSLHGMNRDAWRRYQKGGSWKYEVVMPGFKYNMMDIQAALGIAQLAKLGEFSARRLSVARAYDEGLADCPEVELPQVRPDVESAWHLYPIRLRLDALTIDRDAFMDALAGRKIGASVHFIPVHLHPYYRERYGYAPNDFPVCHREYLRLISLPMSAAISDREIERVVHAVKGIVAKHRR